MNKKVCKNATLIAGRLLTAESSSETDTFSPTARPIRLTPWALFLSFCICRISASLDLRVKENTL
jgi:hypothetical protein